MIFQYDGTNECCPLPLVKTRVLLKKMQYDDTCIIRISDQGSLTDIPKYLTKKGYNFFQREVAVNVFEIHITIGTS